VKGIPGHELYPNPAAAMRRDVACLDEAMNSVPESLVVLLSLALSFMSGALATEPVKPAPTPVSQLIDALGSPYFAAREAAAKELLQRDDALPKLRRAQASPNAEVARRSRVLVDALTNRSLSRYLAYGRTGRIDVFVEWIGLCDGPIEKTPLWQGLLDIAWDLLRKARSPDEAPLWAARGFPGPSLKEFQKLSPVYSVNDEHLTLGRPTTVHAIRTRHFVKGVDFTQGILVTTAPFETRRGVFGGIVFSTSSIAAGDDLLGNLIVADGDVRSRFSLKNVILARGDVHISEVPREFSSTVHASGSVQIGELIQMGKRIKSPDLKLLEGSEIRSGVLGRAGLVRFFEIGDMGIEVSADTEAVRLEKLITASPLAKAGLRVGDLITSIDGKKTPTADTLRRQLRRAFVTQEANVTVRREGKLQEINVSFFGFELPK